jgi:hypothetical protein
MFMLSMPAAFKIGDSAACHIFGRYDFDRVTWRDDKTLVFDPGNVARTILARRAEESGSPWDGQVRFICADLQSAKMAAARPRISQAR